MTTVHDRSKVFVLQRQFEKQRKGTIAAAKVAELRRLDSADREKRVRLVELQFLSHRLPGEPLSVDARWK